MNIKYLFEEWYFPLIVYAKEIVCQIDVAQDIVADAYIKLLTAKDINPRSFLYTAVKNGCFDHLRKQKVRVKNHYIILEDLPAADNETADEYERAYAEYIALLYNRLNSLTPRRKEVLILYSQGYTTQEISIILKIDSQTVRNIKTKGFECLRKILCPPELP